MSTIDVNYGITRCSPLSVAAPSIPDGVMEDADDVEHLADRFASIGWVVVERIHMSFNVSV